MNYLVMSNNIYKRDSAGKIRVWRYEVEGSQYCTVAGLEGGSLVRSEPTVCKAKSQPTDEAQAIFEAKAEETKKLKREYRRTIEELDAVPPSPMLAQDYAKLKKPLDFKGQVYCQPKLDGIRALISRHGAFSREYQPHYNVDHILEALKPLFAVNPDWILDGELYNHQLKDDFNKITSVVRKQNPSDEQRIEARKLIQFHVYDFIEIGKDRPFGQRIDALHKDLRATRPPESGPDWPIWMVETSSPINQEELDQFYGRYLELGYEGQMVRLDQPYEVDKRSKTLLKRKEFITAEFPLLRVEEGLGNWAGYAKRIVFKLPDGRECGAGLRGTQEYAKTLLDFGQHLAAGKREGSLVTIRHFTPTPDGVPRFPVAVDFHFGGRVD